MENPYLSPTRVRASLRALELRPTRGMGQNFLIDPDALAAIVAAAELALDDIVLEVGPGLGVLTWELLRAADRVVAVELDKRLAERLSQEFQGDPRLTIVQGDILKLPPGHLVSEESDKETRRQGGFANADLLVSWSPGLPVSESSVVGRRSSYKVV